MRIRAQCRDCGLPYRATLEDRVKCPNCGTETPVAPSGWSDNSIEVCPLCDCRHLYRQRDINRAWGCLLVVIGAILVPWTYGLSLVLLSLVDFLVYRKLRNAVVCYRCDTVFRDAVPGERQGEFDLLKHDVLKYGKTWDETRTPESPG